MDWTRSAILALILAGLAMMFPQWVAEVSAQACETPVCRQGYRLTRYRERLVCHTGSGLEPQSFYYAPDPICPPGSDLRGQNCVRRVCCEKPACPADRRYDDGKCLRTGFGGVISYTRAVCEAGWELDRPTGLCKNRNCGPAIGVPDLPIAVPAPTQIRPGPFVAGFQPEGCIRKGSVLSILGREFGVSQRTNRVELGGHGIGIPLPVSAWSDTRITATLPNDARITDGQSYYIGLKSGAGHWISNIDRRITTCR